MKVYSTINGLREAISVHRKQSQSIGFVPTMGYLHAGHMELVARASVQNDIVVASIFVNPLQFGPDEDLQRYPRDLARDATMLREAGVSILFAPGVEDMYPQALETSVAVSRLSDEMEGAVRPGHFSGVATVVCKLFNMVQPDRAYFGEKDFQQVVIIKRMVDDLSIPVEIVSVPIVRDVDGLAMSSRNVYLSSAERRSALVVPRALDVAERLIKDGMTDASEIERRIVAFLEGERMAKPEIVAIRDAATLCRVDEIDRRCRSSLRASRINTAPRQSRHFRWWTARKDASRSECNRNREAPHRVPDNDVGHWSPAVLPIVHRCHASSFLIAVSCSSARTRRQM